MKIGDKIKVNNGPIETLIEFSHPFALFQSGAYSVVRNVAHIKDSEKIS